MIKILSGSAGTELNESGDDIEQEIAEEEEILFNGYANVIPVRGKDSSTVITLWYCPLKYLYKIPYFFRGLKFWSLGLGA